MENNKTNKLSDEMLEEVTGGTGQQAEAEFAKDQSVYEGITANNTKAGHTPVFPFELENKREI